REAAAAERERAREEAVRRLVRVEVRGVLEQLRHARDGAAAAGEARGLDVEGVSLGWRAGCEPRGTAIGGGRGGLRGRLRDDADLPVPRPWHLDVRAVPGGTCADGDVDPARGCVRDDRLDRVALGRDAARGALLADLRVDVRAEQRLEVGA